MILTDLVGMILRLAELAFAAIVAGINGHYLHRVQGVDSWSLGRFIYAEVVAGISIFLALIWLFPFSGSFVHWPVDIVISICWFVAFGLIVNVSVSLSVSSLPLAKPVQTGESPSQTSLFANTFWLVSSLATLADTSSTGVVSRSAVSTSAATGRPSSPLASCRPFAGSSLPSSASSGSATTSAAPTDAAPGAGLASNRLVAVTLLTKLDDGLPRHNNRMAGKPLVRTGFRLPDYTTNCDTMSHPLSIAYLFAYHDATMRS